MKPGTKVLLTITQSDLGGAQQYVEYLASGLVELEANVEVVCGEGGPLVERLTAANIPATIFPSIKRNVSPASDVRALRELSRYLHDGNFDVIHGNSSKAGLLSRLAGAWRKVPVNVYTVHGLVLNEPLSPHVFQSYRIAEKIGARLSTHIIAVSDYDKASLVRYSVCSAEQVTVIHNGISAIESSGDRSQLRGPEARSRLGLDLSALVVGVIANFYPSKGLDTLLHALPCLLQTFPDLQLAIIGDGFLRSELLQLKATLGLSASAIMLGQIADARRFLRAFDVFVLPSRKEGLPLALLEAMQAEMPIVATNVGGIPEAITTGVSGLLVEPDNPHQLAAAIRTVLSDRQLAESLGARASERVASKFSVQQMVLKTANLYSALS